MAQHLLIIDDEPDMLTLLNEAWSPNWDARWKRLPPGKPLWK
jgi:hypothetical protein